MVEWVKPKYSRSKVSSAGAMLAGSDGDRAERRAAFSVLSNWRAAHSYPLNTFQVTLRRKARNVHRKALVAQRLKRAPSIIGKLRRFPTMNLARMQDIAGCRAVLRTVDEVRRLEKAYDTASFAHELVNYKDYLMSPKASGYRGVHLVYRYRNPRLPDYDRLLVEVQLRSQTQHAWATAVETVGTYLQKSLKASEGPDRWLEFFKFAGAAFSELESTGLVPGVDLQSEELRDWLRQRSKELDVVRVLRTYRLATRFTTTLNVPEFKTARYFLLTLQAASEQLTVQGFKSRELEAANVRYAELEERYAEEEGTEVVLVALSDVKDLQRAYPNYFLDTDRFLATLNRVLG